MIGYNSGGQNQVELKKPCQSLRMALREALYSKPQLAYVEAQLAPIYICHPNTMNLACCNPLPLLSPYIPNTQSTENMLVAIINRVGVDMPTGDKDAKQSFFEYAEGLLFDDHGFKSLTDSEMVTHEEWLDEAKYSLVRKKQLRDLRNSINSNGSMHRMPDHTTSKSFIKWESYATKKAPRSINSPDDITKTLLGPFIKAVETSIKRNLGHIFVKGKRPDELPKIMLDMFGLRPVLETDFTAFEAHHNGVFAKIGFMFLMHMSKNLTHFEIERDYIKRMMLGSNCMKFKHVTAQILQRLMSGVQWTSIINGFMNLVIMSYLSLSAKHGKCGRPLSTHFEEFVGLIEGDDGICETFNVSDDLIAELGIKLKFESNSNFGEASFCGRVCCPVSLTVVTDPIKVIQKIFFLPRQFIGARKGIQLAMLRARAMSLKYQYPNAPVVGPLCDWLLRETRGIDALRCAHHHDVYQREILHLAHQDPGIFVGAIVTPDGRELVNRRYGVTAQEQLIIENGLVGPCPGIDLSAHVTREHIQHTMDHLWFAKENTVMHDCKMVGLEECVAEIVSRGPLTCRVDREFNRVNFVAHPDMDTHMSGLALER